MVEFSVLPTPVSEAAVPFSVLPEPKPVEAVEFSVLPQPQADTAVPFSALPAPGAAEVVESPVAPEPVAAGAGGLALSPAPTASPHAPPTDGWRPPVVSAPTGLRPRPTPPVRPAKPERAAPSGARRVLVGVSAVVLGALCVIAVRAFIRDDDTDGVDTFVPAPRVVTQTSSPATDDGVAPATGVPGDTATTVPTPTAPVVVATAAPEAPATTAPADTPTATTVPVATAPANTTPAPSATQFSGVGNDVISLVGLDLSRTIMVVSHSGVASFELSTLDQDLNQMALIESAVGAVSGTYPLSVDEQATPSYLRVDADGEWVIDIKSVDEARLWQADFITGVGSEVLRYEGGASVLDYTNAGSSNFIVQYIRNPGFDLLVNEIGPISGTTTMQGGPGVVIVDAEGDWALSATPA